MSNEIVELIEVETATAFLDLIRPSNSRWLENGNSLHPWVFRGHRDVSWKLEPTAWRKRTRDSARFQEIFGSIKDEDVENVMRSNTTFPNVNSIDRNLVRQQIAQRRFEFLEVQSFCSLVDDLGFPIPGGAVSMNVPREFSPSSPFESPHPAVGLAQHHGMHTRLIDWTRDPLVAGFFAAEKVRTPNGTLCVWALNRRCLINNFNWAAFVLPRSEIGFLHAQAGLFTFCKNADPQFLLSGSWPTMEASLQPNDYCETPLRKITLPWREASELKRLLYAEGYSKAHLMPSYDNVTATLRSIWDEYEEAANQESKLKKLDVIFQEPDQTGLRGDSLLWGELREYFNSVDLPNDLAEFTSVLVSQFMKFTTQSIFQCEDIPVERYESGGMSGGVVSGSWWRENGIPLLERQFTSSQCSE